MAEDTSTIKAEEETQKLLENELEKYSDIEERHTKSHGKILAEQLTESQKTYSRNSAGTFYSAVLAGLEIGFSYLLLCTVFTFFSNHYSEATVFKLMALVYPGGFILVVLGRSLLFTEQTSLLSLPFFHKKESFGSLPKLWGTLIAGNMLGGFIITLILVWIQPQLHIYNEEAFEKIALHVVDYSGHLILISGILAGWLMGLLLWLLTSTKDTISKMLIIAHITFVLAFTGLHHFIIGNIEVFAGLISSPKISFGDYGTFQSLALLGNAIGGFVFVGLFKYRTLVAGVKN